MININGYITKKAFFDKNREVYEEDKNDELFEQLEKLVVQYFIDFEGIEKEGEITIEYMLKEQNLGNRKYGNGENNLKVINSKNIPKKYTIDEIVDEIDIYKDLKAEMIAFINYEK